MKKIIRATACLLLLPLMFTFTACSASRRAVATPRAAKVVATAGNVKILYEELYYLAMNYAAELRTTYGEDALNDPEHRAELEAFVNGKLLTRETALLSVGYDYGLRVQDGEIAEQVQAYLDDLLETDYGNDRKAYLADLNAAYATDHYMRACIGLQEYLANEIVLKMIEQNEVDISDQAIAELAASDRLIRTIHVFIDRNNGLSDGENLSHANEVWQTVSAAGTDSERYEAMRSAVGGKYNCDWNDVSGAGYYFTAGEMDSRYEAASFALAEYGVSEVVETEDGYYIIMRLPKEQSYIESHTEQLKAQCCFVILNDKVDERLAGMTLEKTKFGESLDLTALPPIDSDGGTPYVVIGGILCGLLVAGVAVGVVFAIRRGKRRKKQ